MSNLAILVAMLSGSAYAAYAISAMSQFLSYCEQVALCIGRTQDNADLKTQDDHGHNAFRREQLRMLRSGEFMNYKDAAIVAHGIVVARKLKISFWAAVGLVLSVAVANQLTM